MLEPSGVKVETESIIRHTIVRNESFRGKKQSQVNKDLPPVTHEHDILDKISPPIARASIREAVLPSLKHDSYRNKSARSLFRNIATPSVMHYRNLPYGTTIAAIMTEEEFEAVMGSFAEQDTNYNKTWTRIVVEKVLSKYSFYFPRKDALDAPSLSKAYAFYEHITLPRHFINMDEPTSDHILRRSEPGESTETTELYSPFWTPARSLIEWGIGIDLYFATLWIMALVLFFCGCIHLPNLVFYRNEYNGDTSKDILSWSLRGSAVCTDTEWVVCSDCNVSQWDSPEVKDRFKIASDGTVLVLHNLCPGGEVPQGVVSLVSLLFLAIALFGVSMYLGALEVRFDADKTTCKDYSIVVKNPPNDAYDPDEWRDFFSQFAEKQVTAVTVALGNDILLRKLIARRIHRNNLRLILPKGIDMEDEAAVRTAVSQYVHDRDSETLGCMWNMFVRTILPVLRLFNKFLPAESLVDRVFALTEEIKQLQDMQYDVAKVFVTFETEEGQHSALSALSTGRWDLYMNNTDFVAPSAIFKGHLLRIDEPCEPSAVRWLDLSASTRHKVLVKVLNLLLTILLIALSGYAVAQARDHIGAWVAAPLITISNLLIPSLVKALMIFEPHATEGSFQAALYFKITLFRWTNTAFLVKFLPPWTSTLQEGVRDVLPQINAILWSELWISPLLRLSDIPSNFRKHILAPRARNQELMNLNFQGTKYSLAERYTDLTKVLFVCFYFSALYPAAFFFGTAILAVQYFTDKFCLMRIWANSACLGSEVAKFSRRYFFSFAVLAYAIISAYAFAGFPYDNLCMLDAPDTQNEIANGTYVIANTTANQTVTNPMLYVYCDQRWSGFSGLLFPPTAASQPTDRIWMSESQESLANAYGWTAVAFLVGFVFLVVWSGITANWRSWFGGEHGRTGQIQNIDFSANEGCSYIYGYVPQFKIAGIPFPLLACDVDTINQGFIGWNDPYHSYDIHNLIFDIPWKGLRRRKMIERNTRDTTFVYEQSVFVESTQSVDDDGKPLPPLSLTKPIFSIVKHYPPEWKKKSKVTQ